MAEITLGGKKEIKTLKVNIGKKSYSVPLAGSLTIAEMKQIKDGTEDGFDIFGKYIPKEVTDMLTVDDFKVLSDAWKKASSEESGVELGE